MTAPLRPHKRFSAELPDDPRVERDDAGDEAGDDEDAVREMMGGRHSLKNAEGKTVPSPALSADERLAGSLMGRAQPKDRTGVRANPLGRSRVEPVWEPDGVDGGSNGDSVESSDASGVDADSSGEGLDASVQDGDDDDSDYIEIKTRPLGVKTPVQTGERNPSGVVASASVTAKSQSQPVNAPFPTVPLPGRSLGSGPLTLNDVPAEIASQLDEGERVLAVAKGDLNSRVVATNKRIVAYSWSEGERLHDVPYEHVAGLETVKSEPAAIGIPLVAVVLAGVTYALDAAWPWLAGALLAVGILFHFMLRGAKVHIRSSGGDVITLVDADAPDVDTFVKTVRAHRVQNT